MASLAVLLFLATTPAPAAASAPAPAPQARSVAVARVRILAPLRVGGPDTPAIDTRSASLVTHRAPRRDGVQVVDAY